MATDITVPTLGESVKEATVARWFKKVGDRVEMDEPVVELETDKVTVEVNAKAAGTLAEIRVPEGENVAVGALLGSIGEGGAAKPAPAKGEPEKAEAKKAETLKEPAPKAPTPKAPAAAETEALAPSVRRLVEENRLDPKAIPASGKDGRLTKGDVLAHMEGGAKAPRPEP